MQAANFILLRHYKQQSRKVGVQNALHMTKKKKKSLMSLIDDVLLLLIACTWPFLSLPGKTWLKLFNYVLRNYEGKEKY